MKKEAKIEAGIIVGLILVIVAIVIIFLVFGSEGFAGVIIESAQETITTIWRSFILD